MIPVRVLRTHFARRTAPRRTCRTLLLQFPLALRFEGYLAVSGLEATVLRPSGFLQNLLTGVTVFTDDGALLDPYGGGAVGYLDATDIAACACAVLTGAVPRGGVHDLTGTRAITHADLASLLSEALGVPVPVVSPSVDDLVAGLLERGLPRSFADDVALLARGVAAGELAVTTSAVRDLTGRDPRDAADFVAAHVEELHALVARGHRPAS